MRCAWNRRFAFSLPKARPVRCPRCGTRRPAKLTKGADKSFADSLKRVRAAIKFDGEVADCDADLPARLLRHAWSVVQKQKAEAFRANLDRLVLKLSDIFKAYDERSETGRSAKHLKASVGTGFGDAFDFDAMSRILAKALPKDEFPESRRKRIRALLDVLGKQQFFPAPAPAAAPAKKTAAAKPYAFLFDSCAEALQAFRERLPKLIELAKAIAVAELEIDGQYDEAKHDALFEQFGANGLDPQELAPFPDYLVCVNAGKLQASEHAQLMEILSSSLPIKVLFQIDDILEEAPDSEGSLTTGMRSRQIANMAIGLNQVYVLQSSSSNLFQFRERLLRGLAYRGPALFSVFSGASAQGLRPAALSDGGGGDGIARLPGLHLRSVGGRGLGVAFLPRCQFADGTRLADPEFFLRGRGASERVGGFGLHPGRFRRQRPPLRPASGAGSAPEVERQPDPGGRIADARTEGPAGQGAQPADGRRARTCCRK